MSKKKRVAFFLIALSRKAARRRLFLFLAGFGARRTIVVVLDDGFDVRGAARAMHRREHQRNEVAKNMSGKVMVGAGKRHVGFFVRQSVKGIDNDANQLDV
jgi:redox-regulated HSP33 family molecular chaperone